MGGRFPKMKIDWDTFKSVLLEAYHVSIGNTAIFLNEGPEPETETSSRALYAKYLVKHTQETVEYLKGLEKKGSNSKGLEKTGSNSSMLEAGNPALGWSALF